LERIIWAGETVCPHCGGTDRITKVKANPAKRIREGLWRCGQCKGQFTVKIGTVFEHMRLPLHKALQAVYLVTSSKKGISARQLHRTLEITYKSAWFLLHRIREAMRDGDLTPFGGNGDVVEVDETVHRQAEGCSEASRLSISTAARATFIAIWPSLSSGITTETALGCNDTDRADRALEGIMGKRLTYQTAGGATA
jgi:transposase-like protein